MKRRMRDIAILIVGMLLVGVPVMAVSYIPSRDVSYRTEYNENVTNVEEALDILTNQVKEINNTGNSTSSDILSGKSAYVNGKFLTGTMANYSGSTKTASNITESGSNALITIPGGFYDESSNISVPLNTIEELPTIKSNFTDYLISRDYTSSGTILENNQSDVFFNIDKIDGYTPLFITPLSSGSHVCFVVECVFATSTRVRMYLHNVASVSVTTTPKIRVVYKRV